MDRRVVLLLLVLQRAGWAQTMTTNVCTCYPSRVNFTECWDHSKCWHGDQTYRQYLINSPHSGTLTHGYDYLFVTMVTGLVWTLVLNGLLLAVLMRPRMRSANNTFLCIMALVDVLTVLTTLPGLLMQTTENTMQWWDKFFRDKPRLVLLVHLLEFPASRIVHKCLHLVSLYVALGLTVQRYIVVRCPLKAHLWLSKRNMVIYSIFLALFVIVSYGPRFLGYDLSTPVTTVCCSFWKYCYYYISVWGPVTSRMSRFFFSQNIEVFYMMYLQAIHVLALLAIVIVNVLLAFELKKASRKKKGLTRSAQAAAQAQTLAIRRTTKLVGVIMTMLVLVELPDIAASIVTLVDNLWFEKYSEHLDFETTTRVKKGLLLANLVLDSFMFPIEFFVYLCTSGSFREELWALTGCQTLFAKVSRRRNEANDLETHVVGQAQRRPPATSSGKISGNNTQSGT